MNLPWPVRQGKVKGKWVLTATFGFFLHLEDQTSYLSPKLNCALRLHPPLLPVQWPWKCPPVAPRLVLSGNANRGAGRGPPRGPIFLSVGSPRSRRDRGAALGRPEKQRLYWSDYLFILI